MATQRPVKVFDFFSGCGGTSSGFQSAGMKIQFALDIDPDAACTFKRNFPAAHVVVKDICEAEVSLLKPLLAASQGPILFCGCAPCQPFSRQNGNKRKNDPRRNLLTQFGRFVEYWKPDYVFVENVPGLQRLPSSGPLKKFLKLLARNGYQYDVKILPALWFGIPQTRERLVLLASKRQAIALPEATHGSERNQQRYSSVRDWIGNLPEIVAGAKHPYDPDHQSARLSELNRKRISATPEGGGREAWPRRLWLACHKDHKGHTDVYGRLSWDAPASGLTTRCISYSNGRFGHPTQDRALSVREAACLQTFPRRYEFVGSLQSRARQIGNAVPPLMAKAVGIAIQQHLINSAKDVSALRK